MAAIMQKPLKIGIVGFGRLAQQYYAPALRKMDRQLAIHVADPLESSRDAAARAFRRSRNYSGYRELLEREPLDAVLVAAPPSKHLEIWQTVKPAGLPVFMEKPFLMAHEMDAIDPEDPAWARLMVNFNRRFWPAYENLGQLIGSKVLGTIRSAQFVLHVDTRKWSQVSDHRARPEEGGVLYDLGSQLLDLALTSFAESPSGIEVQHSGGHAGQQHVILRLHFPPDVSVSCDLAYGNTNRESVAIVGDEASAHLRNPNFLCWVEKRHSAGGRLVRTAADLAVLGYRGIFRSRSMLRYSVEKSLGAFFRALETAGPFSPGFQDALRVAHYTRLAWESIEGQAGRRKERRAE